MKLRRHYEEYEYLYDSEEEKIKHSRQMKEYGFEDSGKSMINVCFDFGNKNYKWYGKYFKYLDY